MKFRARLINEGHVKGVATLEATDQASAEREANEGINVLSGQWVEIRPIREDAPDRADLVREAVETMKHPENIGAG
jgi:hypothetical protein